MPEFSYKAKAAAGNIIEGEVDAQDQRAAIDQLRGKKLTVLEISEKKPPSAIMDIINKLNPLRPKVKDKDLVIFSRQLATLVGAGVPIVQGLTILTEQIENPRFKEIADNIRDDIESGSAIADAMGKHPEAFSELFVNMIRAGELGGILDVILERLADYLESASDLKGKVKGALVYPAVVSSVAVGVTLFLMVFVIPSFEETFTSFGSELPLPTQVMINISHIMQKYVLLIILGIVGLVIGFRQYYKTDSGSKVIDAKILNLPVFGVLLRKVAIAKFTRTFGTLVKSGVPILEALDTVARTSGNRTVEAAVVDAKEAIREGERIAEPLGKSGVFPPMVMQMISVGEETGNLDLMLGKIADFYDSEVDVAVEGLTSMIEPIIIVFMGLIIGAVVIAMFMPIFQMGSLIGG
ncbi:MAG: type II secretion system F family protein [Elusimicrobia bacterium]|nr:type II secretion system F family protein [Elusimicrobiota bacterium]